MSMNIHGRSGVRSVSRRVMVEVDERSFPPIQGALLDVNAGILADRSILPTGEAGAALIEMSIELPIAPDDADPIIARQLPADARAEALFAESSISAEAEPAPGQVLIAVSDKTFPGRTAA